MTIWYVHRHDNGAIASAHEPDADGNSPMPDYCGEALADSDPELKAFLNPPTDIEVTRLRFFVTMEERGLTSALNMAVQAAGPIPQLYLRESTTFRLLHPLVQQIGKQALGMTDEQLRELFVYMRDRTI